MIFRTSLLDSIDILSQHQRREELLSDHLVAPINTEKLLRKDSFEGSISEWYVRSVELFTGSGLRHRLFDQLFEKIASLFQEIISFENAIHTDRTAEERLFYGLRAPVQEFYGACYEQEFFERASKVSFVFFQQHLPPPSSRHIAADIFSHLSGFPREKTERILTHEGKAALIDPLSQKATETPEGTKKWIAFINRTCLPVCSPRILSLLLSLDTGIPSDRWKLAWRLYHKGLQIGTSAMMVRGTANVPSHSIIDRARSEETRHLQISWLEDPDNDAQSAITSAHPLLFGLWSLQREDSSLFFFPTIPMICLAEDGQSAIVTKPCLFLSSEEAWGSHSAQTAILTFLHTIMNSSFMPSRDLARYCIMEDGSISSLCPTLPKEREEFSWREFEELCMKITRGDEEKLSWLFSTLQVSQHRDITWLFELFSRYGLSFSKIEIQREFILAQEVLHEHASRSFLKEILHLRQTLYTTHKELLLDGYALDERQFLSLFFEVMKEQFCCFSKNEKAMKISILQGLNF